MQSRAPKPHPFLVEEEEKTVVMHGGDLNAPYMGVVAGAVDGDDWPDARTVLARPTATGLSQDLHVAPPRLPPMAAIPAPAPVNNQSSTKILDLNEMHEWISMAAPVGEFPKGTAEVDRARRSQSQAEQVAELFALPPQVAEEVVERGNALKILKWVAVGVAVLVTLVGSLAIFKPELAQRAKAAIIPQPVSAPVLLSIEVVSSSEATVHGPSVNEEAVERLSARAAKAMLAGKQTEALSLYRELHSLIPESTVYAGFVKTLKQKEVER